MRTTVWHVIRLAWTLYKCKTRKHLRIGQMVVSASKIYSRDSFYAENEELLAQLKMLDAYSER